MLDAQGSFTEEVLRSSSTGHTSASKALKFLEGSICRSVDAVITSSPVLSELMRDRLGVANGRLFTVPDGVDCEQFAFSLREDSSLISRVRARLNIPPGAKVVVYVGLFSQLQGVDLLLQAIPNVLSELPDTYFVIAGYPNQSHYEGMARELGIQNFVRFPGRVDHFNEAPHLLAVGDVAVAPKRLSSQSNGKVLAYSSMGLPTVVFDNYVNRFLLGDCGVYAREESPAALAGALVGLLKDDARRLELQKSCRERVERNFTWTQVGVKLMDIYQHVAEELQKKPRRHV